MIKHRSELHKIIDLSLPAAEIGVAEGLFSKDILSWGVSFLYMVDNWGRIPGAFGDGDSPQEWHDKNYSEAVNRVTPWLQKVKVLRGMSVAMAEQVPDESLGLVYLDACHTYECVTADLEAWLPKLVKGGIMAGHDFLAKEYGVQEAVKDFTKGRHSVNLIPENRKADAGFWFKK
jgi:cephalosporin hydroxylase